MDSMLVTLEENNFSVVEEFAIPPKWTNNACESMNHVVKSLQNYTPDKLPGLVETINDLYKRQHEEERQALYGQGNNYVLQIILCQFCSRKLFGRKLEKCNFDSITITWKLQ